MRSPETSAVGGEEARPEVEGDNGAPAPGSRWRSLLLGVVVVAMVAAGGYWYYDTHIRGYDATDDAFIDGNRVGITSRVLGRITFLACDEGDTVTQGSVVVRLDDAELRSQEAQASAVLNDARQSIALAEVNLARAREDFRRAETQFQSRVIPQESFDHAKTALAAASTQERIAQARRATAEAQIQVVRAQLANTVLVAPMSGVVAKRYALPGDVVQAGQPILSVYDLSTVWVTANFEETRLGAIHMGDPVEVQVDAYPDRRVTGRVVQFGASTASQYSLIPPNNASGNFTKVTQRVPVKIRLDAGLAGDPQHPLLPGMSVSVRIKVR